jgi:tRNA G10  N-methylase Trm11
MAAEKYLYLIAIPSQLTELASAESVTLTGAAPDEYGITVSDTCTDVCRGAYLKSCTEVLFEVGSVSELYANIRSVDLHADGFRVSVVKKPRNLNVDSMALARQIGGVIGGKPNLSSPQVVFLTVITPEKIWFGRLLSESDSMWVAHDQRPHVTSSSLPARLARALVNLVASPGEHLLDPCCGTGTIVMSAAHCGVQASGYDINPRMVGATTKNLKHYGLTADVQLNDARTIQRWFDVIATDLPYGISLVKDTAAAAEILANLRTCAPKAGFIDIRDLSQPLADLGYQVETIIPVPKMRLVRRIFITSNGDQ